MIYTSIPLPRSQVSPDAFKDRGNGNEAPAPISETRISIARVKRPLVLASLYTLLWAFVGAFLTETKIFLDGSSYSGFTAPLDLILFTIPPLVVTLAIKSEDKEIKLSELGFSAQSSGRYKYYKGPANDDTTERLLRIGVEADCWAPYGSSNIRGYIALGMITKLLNAALGFVSHFSKDMSSQIKAEEEREYIDGSLWNANYSITSAEDVTEAGYFFPYFNGLVLPDKAETPRILIGYFSSLFGSRPQDVLTSIKNLQEGWVSLSNTTAGLEISHLVFGIDLAIRGNCRIKPVFLNSIYSGFVLTGEDFLIAKGSSMVKKTPLEALREEISEYDQHGDSIAKLVLIISAAPIEATKEASIITANHILSPRALHNQIRIRVFSTEKQNEINALVPKLRYSQKLFDLSDKLSLSTILKKIARKEFLPDSAPFYLRSNALFTKDPIFSSLAAYGPRAPSFIGMGNNTMVRITKGKRFYSDLPGSVKLEGIPVFFKPLAQAMEDFRTIYASGVITFKGGMKDKKGFTKVAGVGTYVPEDNSHFKEILDCLCDIGLRGDKRQRDDSDESAASGGTSMKKAKKGTSTAEELLGFLAKDSGIENVPMDADEDFFA